MSCPYMLFYLQVELFYGDVSQPHEHMSTDDILKPFWSGSFSPSTHSSLEGLLTACGPTADIMMERPNPIPMQTAQHLPMWFHEHVAAS